ncbi:MAG: M1 family metallopeptidase [Bacteroidota bacterium]|nr:M1 family metallopeptidase [Bacteroidota bacterium]MDP4247141.1 M1 family metallopeptidase [Bacteroidota bacterium]MDP4257720.1 M1 family metallopeptidase [Bacteroidota bacterium]
MSRIVFLLSLMIFLSCSSLHAQLFGEKKGFTHADTVRGSIGPARSWWNVIRYDIRVRPDYEKRSITGQNEIRFMAIQSGQTMQIDLRQPMNLISATWRKVALPFKREGNAFYISFPKTLARGSIETLTLNFEGNPVIAARPPWDGGWIFTRDKLGRPWMSVACQGLGASVWYPCKDHQSDEPDSGASLRITVPDTLVAVGNGRLKEKKINGDGTATYTWEVVNPINNYDIVPYIGKYVTWHEEYPGLKGKLDCDYWVLDYNREAAMKQFKQADSMLHCFEYWMGPYPFYEDGYKLVEAPHLGMEHQSAVAYGNHFENGYLGRDLSGSGWGKKWDFIIVHESGHEWFGNNITSNDLADMWVHEGFTNYTETLYTTCQDGVEAGDDYVTGTRKNIRNDKPIIGHYGVNEEGSGDMYYKSGNMLHMIRQIMGDDSFRTLLHALNTTYYHKTVDSKEIEQFISRFAGRDLSSVFDQYLRTTQVPVLEYRVDAGPGTGVGTGSGAGAAKGAVSVRWTNCVKGFALPLKVSLQGAQAIWIMPTEDWQVIGGTGGSSFAVDRNFYVTVKKVD